MSLARGNILLKIAGILMIIGAALSIILGVVGVVGMVLYADDPAFNSAGPLPMIAAVIAVVGGILQLIAGIIGLKNSDYPEKAVTCIIWGFIVLVVNIVDQIISNIDSSSTSLTNTIFGIVISITLPILYLVGAFLNKRSA